jgi:epoxide hydrolase A/B
MLCLAATVGTSSERLVDTNGVQLRVTEAGRRGAPVVVLAHGFPELAYSWRHQIPALADAGYHVLAPDQRGYGGSSRPEAIDDYDVVALTGDIAGLLDDVGADKAVIVGHDWGSVVATSFPLFQPGVADAELNGDPARTIRRMLGGLRDSGQDAIVGMMTPGSAGFIDRLPEPEHLPDWITQAEIDHYTEEFTRTGFTGGLNWYRNFDRNWELTESPPSPTIDVPTLFLAGSADPVLGFTPRDHVGDVVTGSYREILFDGAGHWLQQERAAEVNAALLEFLEEVK